VRHTRLRTPHERAVLEKGHHVKNRSLPFGKLLAASLVAVALVLGSVVSADAGALTKKTVKKIAAKVVKKQAKTLSVAHAKTADTASNATRLEGRTATQLGTTAYRYPLPSQATVFNRTYHFTGLPSGNYLISYSYTATGSDPGTQVGCTLFTAAGTGAGSYSVSFGSFARASATDSVTMDSLATFDCGSSGGTFSMNNGTVTFIPIDTVVAGTTVGNTV
jgi:hypothetical protein